MLINSFSDVITYVMSFSCVTVLFVYMLRVPYLITKEKSLVYEYYIQKYVTNIPMDVIFVWLYLEVATYVSKLLGYEKYFTKSLLVTAGTTFGLTSLFMLYFSSTKKNNTFFSRWFHATGWRAGIYDVIIVSSTFFMYYFLKRKLNSNKY